MNLEQLRLQNFSSRGLNVLATIFGDIEARVILSERASRPLTVALESRTIVLDPQVAGLYDLALGARLLAHRRERSRGPVQPDRLDRWLTRQACRRWAADAHSGLHERFPCVGRLQGYFLPNRPLDRLRVVNRTVEWKPLRSPITGLAHEQFWRPHGIGTFVSLEMELLPELEITGAEEDFSWLVESLEKESITVSTLEGMPELPFLRVPLRLNAGERFALLEEWETALNDAENQEMIRDFERCYQRKSEVRQERTHLGRRTQAGLRLDSNRLVEAVVGSRVGVAPRLFRKKGSLVEPVFDPREHLGVIIFDMNDLRDLDWSGNRSAVLRFLVVLLKMYENLNVDVVVQGTADTLLRLGNGRVVCLHFHTVLKSIEQSFDEAFWARLALLVRRGLLLPGTPTCFHPLTSIDIAQAFDQVASEQDHSYRSMVWWARHHMTEAFPEFREPGFMERIADRIDYEMAELERRLSGTFDTMASFLPESLRQYGQPHGYLQSSEL